MSVANLIITRGISTSCARYGKRNFKKFTLINKRGTRIFKKMQAEDPDPRYPIDKRGVRDVGYMDGKKFVEIPEMIPELIVPNLEGFKLKPYVTYKVTEVKNEKFTAEDLFYAVYSKKIREDYNKGKLGPNGEPLEPSPEELLTPKEARELASKPGNDIFTARPKPAGTIMPQIPR
ncbi:hypothetical protein TSAR_014077 [Trichomalopsis sarcophagae]|uniref:39S ribosomal protein L41, mitochondrial n=1 Tax=Trichomalopsis sarcophagae TaxID=543379 RepID=A0A232ETK9_9HYME|nr:hypothetical protein TSAR_014077 [Trichomalopsis sarcophagae]